MALGLVILSLVRFVGLSLIPCFRQYLPHSVRLTIAVCLTCLERSNPLVMSLSMSLAALGGVLLAAIPIAFACESISLAGRLVDIARGAQFSEQLVPGVGRFSQLEIAGGFFALVWIVVVDFEVLINSFLGAGRSYELLAESGLTLESVFKLLVFFADSFYSGVLIAAPLLGIAFLLDASAMVIAKVLPRFPVTYELMPVKLMAILFFLGIRLQSEPASLVKLRNNLLSIVGGS